MFYRLSCNHISGFTFKSHLCVCQTVSFSRSFSCKHPFTCAQLQSPSTSLSFPQHDSALIYHNMASLPRFVGHFRNLFSFSSTAVARPALVKLGCCADNKHREEKRKSPTFFLLTITHNSHFAILSPPCLCTLLSFFILSLPHPHSSGTQPLYSPPCHAAIISQR